MVPERWSLARGMCTNSLLLDATSLKCHLRSNSGNSDTIDLHGTTAAEAIVIVKEILNSEASSISQGKLRISLSLVSTQGCSSSAATSTASRRPSHLFVCPGGCCHFSGSLFSHVSAVLTNLKQNH